MGEFFENGKINVGCGTSFVMLIPKMKDLVELNNYRPINLIDIISKVVSKGLANRLKKVIGSMILESQSTFIKGNYILDGPLLINEITNWGKKTKKKMGFLGRWCSWIKGILESARSSVLVNGSPTFEFQCQKALRQGDPISPFLFIMVMEMLSYMIDKAISVDALSGIQIPKGTCVSHFLYEDNAIILGEWFPSNIRNVANIYAIGVQPGELNNMAAAVGCQAGIFPFKYLGLMVGANMNRVSNWKPVYDIFDARIAKWKAALLSIGGRTTLIKVVFGSLPNYYFSLYKAPVQVIKDLEAKMRNFLWGGDDSVKKLYWVAWDRVSHPKKNGGLDLSKLKKYKHFFAVQVGVEVLS
ncbi:uncharacterized protein LOC110866667 [Helianthus annuus]|uniref:uncharacterized protein LOC110866667 n=1 Tax=Helianthus annuus TaxID=4232 RepID=UPI000B8F2F3A|nr:uncharacterized protein LOC110866667 [Helianthus annuus]